MYVNGELVGEQILDKPIFNYNKTKYINIGSDHNKKHKFKGAIDSVKFLNKHKEDITVLHKEANIDNKVLNQDSFNFSYIPHNRKGKVEKLYHPDLGFKDGVWQNNLTRWNQLRFNNEVLLSTNEQKYEGLSNLRFRIQNKQQEEQLTHLKVGI